MRRPLRHRLHTMADLALAFATLEAVRMPELADAADDPRRPAAAIAACTSSAACAGGARDRARAAGPRTGRLAHR